MENLINGLHPNLALPSSPHALRSPFFFFLYPVGKYKNENGVHNRSLRTQRHTKPINTVQKPSKGRCESLGKGKEMAKELEIWSDLLWWGGKEGWEVKGDQCLSAGLAFTLFYSKDLPFCHHTAWPHPKPGLPQLWKWLKQQWRKWMQSRKARDLSPGGAGKVWVTWRI